MHRPTFVDALARIESPLEALRAKPAEAIRQSENGGHPLYWLKRAMTIYPVGQGETFQLPIAQRTEMLTDGRYGKYAQDFMYPTRTYSHQGNSIVIKAGRMPPESQCYAATSTSFLHGVREEDRIPLNANGETIYHFSEPGVLMLGCSHPDAQLDDEFVKISISGGWEHPLFILGQTTPEDWVDSRPFQMSANKLYFNGRTIVTANTSRVHDRAGTASSTLAYMLRTTSLYERLDGMDGSEPLFKPSQGVLYARFPKIDESMMQWEFWETMADSYVSIDDSQIFRKQTRDKYALQACRAFLGERAPNECHPRMSGYPAWNENAVADFLRSNVHHAKYGDIDPWERLKFFMFLSASYGPDFFSTASQAMLRVTYGLPDGSIGKRSPHLRRVEDRLDYVVEAYSRAAGHDLRDYFSRWGLPFSDKANRRIEAMRLPQPE